MTNPGLYSGIYQHIREYAELVDEVLITLKADGAKAERASREKLSDLLTGLVAERANSLPLRMVGLLIVGDDANSRARWVRVAKLLKSAVVDAALIAELESLAQTLEQIQSDAMAKMRGWSY